MIRFKDLASAYELRLLHPRLYDILSWIVDDGVWKAATGEPDLVITEVWRSRQETLRIYEEAGLPAPAISVHETIKELGNHWSGCRGLDLSIRRPISGSYDGWPLIVPDQVVAFVARVNATWLYHPEDRFKVALYHSVAGPHVHLQVARENVTVRRGGIT